MNKLLRLWKCRVITAMRLVMWRWMAAVTEASSGAHIFQYWRRFFSSWEAWKKRSRRKAMVSALCPQPDRLCCQPEPGLWTPAKGGDERPPSPNPKIGLSMCLGNFVSSEHLLSISSQLPWYMQNFAIFLWKAEFTQREQRFNMDRSIGFTPHWSPLTRLMEFGAHNLKKLWCVCV